MGKDGERGGGIIFGHSGEDKGVKEAFVTGMEGRGEGGGGEGGIEVGKAGEEIEREFDGGEGDGGEGNEDGNVSDFFIKCF